MNAAWSSFLPLSEEGKEFRLGKPGVRPLKRENKLQCTHQKKAVQRRSGSRTEIKADVYHERTTKSEGFTLQISMHSFYICYPYLIPA